MIDHITIPVSNVEESKAFYTAALAAGARDNGKPGPRPEYTEGYYACFILDPDDDNLDAMIDMPSR